LGQCADLQLHHHPLVSLEIYEKIVIGKSGALLSLPIELALVAVGNSEAIAIANQAANSLALGYQIFDDLCDEKDDSQQCEGQLPRLNIAFVLQAAGHNTDFRSLARDIAQKHLVSAQNLAQQLPHGAGDCIIDLAQYLCQRL
jgi:geranylgeranyl pyrophosphate synthase